MTPDFFPTCKSNVLPLASFLYRLSRHGFVLLINCCARRFVVSVFILN